jgi:hypothetical protein
MNPPMLHRARIPALLLAAALAVAVEAPTEAEWAPVAQALEAGGAESVTSVEAITVRFPKWPDGHRALASARLRAGDPSGAWKAARAALSLDKTDTVAAALGMQALSSLGRYDDAYKVADLFTDATDVGGPVAAQAAICALQARNDARLATYLAAAKARTSGAAPILDFVAAKQAQRAKDLPAAAAALERVVATRPDYRDALYELGRVRTVQAMQTPAQAAELLAKAEEAFIASARQDRHDADSRFGLGRARLEHGKSLIATGKVDDGAAMLRLALTALDEGLQLEPGNREGKLWKGDALLRLERFAEAASLLKQAFAAGAIDRALPFNLSLALARSGKPDEAAKVLENVEAEGGEEQLILAMNAVAQGNWAAAQSLLTKSLDDLPTDTPEAAKRRWSAYRYLGHCARELAATATPRTEVSEEQLETAAKFYKEAGDNGDFPSRHWYLHLQAQRSPLEAFKAGQQSLKWDGMWNLPAWKLLAGNYGWKVSHGEGLAGTMKHGPAHLMLWGLLVFITVGLFLKGWLLPGGLYGGGGGGAKPKPKTSTRAVAKPGSAAGRKPAAAAAPPRKPATAPMKPVKPMPRALIPKDGTGPKTPFSE